DSMPDITMVLPLAAYFNVSADELLGLDAEKNAAKIREYLDERRRLNSLGKSFEAFALICEAYNEFPNDWEIISRYVEALCYDPHYTEEPFGGAVHLDEIVRLSNRILDECTNSQIRFFVTDILMSAYSWSGQQEKAIPYADQFPENYYYTKWEQLRGISDGDEELRLCRKTTYDMAEHMLPRLHCIAQIADTTTEKRIELYKKVITIADAIFDEGDYGFQFWELGYTNGLIARCYIKLGSTESALEHMERGLEYAKTYDEMFERGEDYVHTSFLVAGITHNPGESSTSGNGNRVAKELALYNGYEIDDPRFREIAERYRPFAKE
ncbi:MAG: hypothetical protein LBC38_04810, partial [Oscillospiraceae bacterium]|nr:hypothetical protein [Oscillospiraceae bacterium]